MKIAIIEDEIPARHQLIALLKKLRDDIEIEFEAASIREAVTGLKSVLQLDLIFMDIQLNDGLSLDIFNQVEVRCPVIFATAFDHYTLEAFQQNGIDYLLKPIKKSDLEVALLKYDRLQQHFIKDFSKLLAQFSGEQAVSRKRILVKKGIHFSSVPIEEVQYFFSQHKITFMVDQGGQKAIVDETLAELESTLDPARFFRINRKYLVAIQAVERFTGDGKGKLLVNLNSTTEEEVLVSQEKAGAFKQWIMG